MIGKSNNEVIMERIQEAKPCIADLEHHVVSVSTNKRAKLRRNLSAFQERASEI